MKSRGNLISDAVASYLESNVISIPIVIAEIRSAPVIYITGESQNRARIFVYPMEVTTAIDTRDSYRDDHKIGISVVSLLPSATDDAIEELQAATERIRNLVKDVTQAGAEFWQIANESAVPEFDLASESQGQYFVSTVEADYVIFD